MVLDFDGVICDSVEECLASSWIAYHVLYRHSDDGETPDSVRAAFRAMRPFIRSGEDFVLIQALIAEGKTVQSQIDFDLCWKRPGIPSRNTFKELFYQARTDLLKKNRQAWLALNKVYPHVQSALSRIASNILPYIVSTKQPQFVNEILEANSLSVPAAHVLYSHSEPKLTTVEKLLETLGCEKAIMVEDQLDAIQGNTNPRIHVYLASWGYVREEWLNTSTGISVLSPEDFVSLVIAQST
jgi:phosphoglycolate phosphatase-like HAD superfamily hydrolase